MIKISGLEKLGRDLDDAQKALAAIDGEIGTVSFNPNDPGSIEAAIQQVETMIDERLGAYLCNPIIGPLAEQMKTRYREGIIEKAAASRLANETDGQ